VPADRQHDHIGWEAAAGEGGSWQPSRARAARSHAGSLAARRRPPRTPQRPRGYHNEPGMPAPVSTQ
jgi:hypothetical protein